MLQNKIESKHNKKTGSMEFCGTIFHDEELLGNLLHVYTHNIKSKFPPKEPHQIVQYNKSFKLKPSMGYS